jgi:protein-S-isoprenylcysteine O-methyltransferase Ste14
MTVSPVKITATSSVNSRAILKMVGGVALQIALVGLPLFGPAPTLDWPRAWILLSGIVVGTAATLVYLRAQQDLIEERLRLPLQRGQPISDKIVSILLVLAIGAVIGFIPLDVFRWHFMVQPGVIASFLGAGLIVGVYSKVRHPIYAGGLAFLIGTCLWLGSYAATFLVVVPIILLAVRIEIEERVLSEALGGYQAYRQRVRYRLIPCLW